MILKILAKNVKHYRIQRGCSQEKLAEGYDMSRSFISQIESPNVDTGVSLDTLFYVAQNYDFGIREFFKNYKKISII